MPSSMCLCVCVCLSRGACLCAGRCILDVCACERGTLKDLSLSLRCVNEQSVLLIFSRAYPALAAALPVVTAKPRLFKSVDIVLAVGSAYAEDTSLCFLPSTASESSGVPDRRRARYKQGG